MQRPMKSFMKYLRKNKLPVIYLAAALLLVLSVALGLFLGASRIDFFGAVGALLRGDVTSPEARILWYVRLPRVAAGLLCGAALSLAGAVIQGVLANRLASPSIIGVSSGAGLAVTVCAAFGITGGFRLSLFAFLGAFFAVMLVSLGAKKWGASRGTVILMGVALNAVLGAFSDAIVTFFPDTALHHADFKIGDFSFVTYKTLIPAAIVVAIAVLVSLTLSGELEVLTLGEDNAKGLGLNTGLARVIFLMLSAMLSGAAVSLAGLLSFVGLLVPHAIRRMGVNGSRHLLSLCVLFGAGFVSLCDTVSRVLFAPYELPVGIIMAFLGAPFFIFILIKGKGGHSRA